MDIGKQEGAKVQFAKQFQDIKQREAENKQAAINLFR